MRNEIKKYLKFATFNWYNKDLLKNFEAIVFSSWWHEIKYNNWCVWFKNINYTITSKEFIDAISIWLYKFNKWKSNSIRIWKYCVETYYDDDFDVKYCVEQIIEAIISTQAIAIYNDSLEDFIINTLPDGI